MEGQMEGSHTQGGREVDFQIEKGMIDECTVSDIGLFAVLDLFLIFASLEIRMEGEG